MTVQSREDATQLLEEVFVSTDGFTADVCNDALLQEVRQLFASGADPMVCLRACVTARQQELFRRVYASMVVHPTFSTVTSVCAAPSHAAFQAITVHDVRAIASYVSAMPGVAASVIFLTSPVEPQAYGYARTLVSGIDVRTILRRFGDVSGSAASAHVRVRPDLVPSVQSMI